MSDIFGIGTAIAGGLNAAANMQSQYMQRQMFEQAQQQNVQQAEIGRSFSAHEAAKLRDFNAGQQLISQDFNAGQASATRSFNSYEAAAARRAASHEAILNRSFSSDEAAMARDFNAIEAAKARDFADAQAATARGFNTREAQTARNWSEYMSNSAYQRATNDMRQAGLNPILAYAQGGASTPGAASATSSAPGSSAASGGAASGSLPGMASAHGGQASASAMGGQMPSSGIAGSAGIPHLKGIMDNVVSSAIEATRLEPQIRNVMQQTMTGRAEEYARRQAGDVSHAQARLVQQQTETEKQRTDAMAKGAMTGQLDEDFYGSKVGTAVRNIGNFMRELNPFVSNAKTLNQMYQGNQ